MPSNLVVAVYGENEMRRVLLGTAEKASDYAVVPAVAKKSVWGLWSRQLGAVFALWHPARVLFSWVGGNFDVHEPEPPSPAPLEPDASCEVPEWPPKPEFPEG